MYVSCIYLTRQCPMKCDYCAIRNSPCGPEQTLEEWKETFITLRSLGVDFHLILGNEAMMIGQDLVELVKFLNEEKMSYALYSTCPDKEYNELRDKLVDAGLQNISCGFDSLDREDSIGIKSRRGLERLTEMRSLGVPDSQLTVTLSKMNLDQIEELGKVATENGHFFAINMIHWDKDGGFDFFPPKDKLEEFIIDDKDKFIEKANIIKSKVLSGELKCQNPAEYFDAMMEYGMNTDWHCSIHCMFTCDADGQMRLCGYRKGKECNKYHITDLKDPDKLDSFIKQSYKEMHDCPGCFWSYQWMAEHFIKADETEFGMKIFQDHASKYWKE